MKDFRCLSFKKVFFFLIFFFLPSMVQLCRYSNNRRVIKQCTCQVTSCVKNVFKWRRAIGKERWRKTRSQQPSQRALFVSLSVLPRLCQYRFKYLAVTCGSTFVLHFCMSEWDFQMFRPWKSLVHSGVSLHAFITFGVFHHRIRLEVVSIYCR